MNAPFPLRFFSSRIVTQIFIRFEWLRSLSLSLACFLFSWALCDHLIKTLISATKWQLPRPTTLCVRGSGSRWRERLPLPFTRSSLRPSPVVPAAGIGGETIHLLLGTFHLLHHRPPKRVHPPDTSPPPPRLARFNLSLSLPPPLRRSRRRQR